MENKNEVTKVMDKSTVEEAIDFILSEGRSQGYNEAMKTYGKQYKEIIRTGRKQGFIIGAALTIIGVIICGIARKKYIKKLKDEAAKKDVENVDPSDVDININEGKEDEY